MIYFIYMIGFGGENVKYLIIGGGGTGGPLAAYMKRAGKDITLIARGEHLNKIKERGLVIENEQGNKYSVAVKACTMEEYDDRPNVIFVCVKSYSLGSVIDFIKRTAGTDTTIIPLLNIFTTGQRLQRELPLCTVTDGCIYISANISGCGNIKMHGDIFRIVFGARNEEEYRPVFEDIKKDLSDSGIDCTLSHNIQRDALKKFSYVSAMAACGLYYDAKADSMQKEGKERRLFSELIGEITALAEAMGFPFDEDMIKTNIDILDDLSPTASTSMQRDIQKGSRSEIDGLIYEVVRLGKKYNVDMPKYTMVSKKFYDKYK